MIILHSRFSSLLVCLIRFLACPCPEPYFTKISKHDAYQLALQYYKIQPDQHTTLGSFLSKVDEIIEWHNNQEVLPVQ